jgi:hypothetical protein
MGAGAFERALDDPTNSIIEDTSTDGDVLVIAFGGIAGKLDGIPPFEFLSVLADQSARRIFVRDRRQAWYQAGTPDGTGTVADFTDPLRALVAARRPRRLVTVGVSAGGFAAIYFGCTLGADHALAFGPQTFTGRWARRIHRENRWAKETANIDALDQATVCRDLRPVVRASARSDAPTAIEIHVGDMSARDLRHARRLARSPNVAVAVHASGHNVARTLRDRGDLAQIVGRAVRPDPLG